MTRFFTVPEHNREAIEILFEWKQNLMGVFALRDICTFGMSI